MGSIKELLAATLDRMELLGRVTNAADQADSRFDDFLLTDDELWAIAYANAPDLFVGGSFDQLIAAADLPTAAHYKDLLGQLRDAYHAGRNDG